MRKTLLSLAFAALCVAAFGCGGAKKPADLPDLYPCKITIIQDEKPLEGATVMLVSTGSDMRFTVGNRTDAKGVADLKTDGKWPGAPAGKYKVLVTKIFIPEMPNEAPPSDPDAKAEFDKKLAELNAQQADVVDVQYKRQNSTPEEIEIAAGGVEKTIDVGAKVNVPLSQSGSSSSDR